MIKRRRVKQLQRAAFLEYNKLSEEILRNFKESVNIPEIYLSPWVFEVGPQNDITKECQVV